MNVKLKEDQVIFKFETLEGGDLFRDASASKSSEEGRRCYLKLDSKEHAYEAVDVGSGEIFDFAKDQPVFLLKGSFVEE